jgi:hypothetical protein
VVLARRGSSNAIDESVCLPIFGGVDGN